MQKNTNSWCSQKKKGASSISFSSICCRHFHWNCSLLQIPRCCNWCQSFLKATDWLSVKETEAEVRVHFQKQIMFLTTSKKNFFTPPELQWHNLHEYLCSLSLSVGFCHGALIFITGCRPLTHYCTVYALVDWASGQDVSLVSLYL